MLKNCHLVTSWLPTLEKEIHGLAGQASPRFRLFLTSEAHPKFPPTLLEACTKVGNVNRNALPCWYSSAPPWFVAVLKYALSIPACSQICGVNASLKHLRPGPARPASGGLFRPIDHSPRHHHRLGCNLHLKLLPSTPPWHPRSRLKRPPASSRTSPAPTAPGLPSGWHRGVL